MSRMPFLSTFRKRTAKAPPPKQQSIQMCASDGTALTCNTTDSRESDPLTIMECSRPPSASTDEVRKQAPEKTLSASLSSSKRPRSSSRTPSLPPQQPSHHIFIGLQANNGPFYTTAHGTFQREVKVWQIRNGGRTRKEELQKKGGLERVLKSLLEEVHKKIQTTTWAFPEMYFRSRKDESPYKVELRNDDHRNKLIDYLVGKRGSCLNGCLVSALTQLKAFRAYLTEKQFQKVEGFIYRLQVMSDSTSDDQSASNGNGAEESNLRRLDEVGNEALLQSANFMLATALKNERSKKKKKARTTTDAKLPSTPSKKQQGHGGRIRRGRSPRRDRGMNKPTEDGTSDFVASGSHAMPKNIPLPRSLALPDLSPSIPTSTVELPAQNQARGSPIVASVPEGATASFTSSPLPLSQDWEPLDINTQRSEEGREELADFVQMFSEDAEETLLAEDTSKEKEGLKGGTSLQASTKRGDEVGYPPVQNRPRDDDSDDESPGAALFSGSHSSRRPLQHIARIQPNSREELQACEHAPAWGGNHNRPHRELESPVDLQFAIAQQLVPSPTGSQSYQTATHEPCGNDVWAPAASPLTRVPDVEPPSRDPHDLQNTTMEGLDFHSSGNSRESFRPSGLQEQGSSFMNLTNPNTDDDMLSVYSSLNRAGLAYDQLQGSGHHQHSCYGGDDDSTFDGAGNGPEQSTSLISTITMDPTLEALQSGADGSKSEESPFKQRDGTSNLNPTRDRILSARKMPEFLSATIGRNLEDAVGATVHRKYEGPLEQLEVIRPAMDLPSGVPPITLVRAEGASKAYAKPNYENATPLDRPGIGCKFNAVVYPLDKKWGAFRVPRPHEAQDVVVKKYNKTAIQENLQERNPYQDVALMQKIGDNIHVLGCIECLDDGQFLYVVTPRACEEGSLEDVIPWCGSSEPMEPRRAHLLFSKILQILTYLEHHGIYHREIHPKNFLFLTQDNLVVHNLGKSVCFPISSTTEQRALHADTSLQTFSFPDSFCTLRDEGLAADLWGAASILYSLITGCLLFSLPIQNIGSVSDEVSSNKLESKETQNIAEIVSQTLQDSEMDSADDIRLSPEAIELLTKVFTPDPRQRWTLKQVAQSSYVKSEADG